MNKPDGKYPLNKTIHQLFEEQVEKTPDHIALVGQIPGKKVTGAYRRDRCRWEEEPFGRISNACGVGHLSYKELDKKSNQLAHLLREKGVEPDTIVGLMVERSIEMVIGVLGILKAGGAYLPVDPKDPAERIKLVLADSKAEVLVTTSPLFEDRKIGRWEDGKNLEIIFPNSSNLSNSLSFSLPLFPASNSSNLAYILYTSGSTGTPKGVAVDHRSVVNLLFVLFEAYPIFQVDAYLLKTSFSFDVSVTELFGWFMGGSRLVILEKEGEKDPQTIISTIEKHQVTHINFAPAMFNAFTHQLDAQNIGKISYLKYIFLAGEVLPPELVNRFWRLQTSIRLENLYGPTEGTVYASWYSLSQWNGTGSIPIGKPLPNVRLYILDKDGHPLPGGETGELCIAGVGIARGYLDNPELTAENFCLRRPGALFALKGTGKNQPHYPIYRTGDLARWLKDGNIEFLGRIDLQVKIRGIRIELGEIESQLLMHKEVKEAVVTAKETKTGDKYLCAYMAAGRRAQGAGRVVMPDISELKEYLSKTLPDYMIPSFFIFLEQLPLTGSGKVDRKVLPEPEFKREVEYTAPRNRLEEKLVEIWTNALEIDKTNIGIDDGFLELGGHSLRGVAVVYDIHKIFNVKISLAELLEIGVIRKLSTIIKEAAEDRYLPLERAEEKDYYALSPAQTRMVILYQMNPGSTVYNLTTCFDLEGALDRQRLENVFNELIARHESFRTCFPIIDGEPVQKIHDTVEFEIKYFVNHDIHEKHEKFELTTGNTEGTRKLAPLSINPATGNWQLATSTIKNFIRPFDLSRAPLLRAALIRIEEEKYLLVLDIHHIVTDGFSMEIFTNELLRLYNLEALSPVGFQYKDYSEWQHQRKRRKELESQKDYWLKEFSGEIPLISLPLDYPRPAIRGFEGNTLDVELTKKKSIGLKALAEAENVTLYMLLLAAYNILLAKLSGQEDIVVGTPMAGREHPELQHTMGMFVNTLAIRTFPGGEKRFNEFLSEIKKKALAAFENQEYPFEELVDEVVPDRDSTRNPLFDCVFALETYEIEKYRTPNLEINYSWYISDISKFDLTLSVEEYKEKLILRVEYRTKLFKQETIQRFIGYFRKILSSLQADAGQKISQMEIISDEEKGQILYRFNTIEPGYLADRTIHRLFTEQVERTPDHTALIGRILNAFDGMHLSYRELNKKSDQLAHLLIEKGVQPETIVGIMAERSVEMIIAILGILKSGCGYVPLNPGAPAARNRYILEDCQVKIFLTNCWAKDLNRGIEVIDLTDTALYPGVNYGFASAEHLVTRNPKLAAGSSLAYVIFTSGSTGKPKGVPITHSNISPLLHWGLHQLDAGPNDRVVQNLSYYFDWSVWEIFIALVSGAGLYIASRDVLLNPETCVGFIKKNDITILHITPTQFQPLVQFVIDSGQKPAGLKYLFIGAEKLTADLVNLSWKAVTGDCRVFNMYGPTEATIISSVLEIKKSDNEKYKKLSSIPIGKPIANTNLLILDKHFNLCPIHVPGELYIGGDGLSGGYLNNPELTAEKFILATKTQRHKEVYFSWCLGALVAKLYKTGDLVRWLPDGNIQFLERLDHQFKIRGFRIETGEIENQLLNHGKIKEAVVVAIEASASEDTYLCAYVVSAQGLSVSELREYLSMKLPDYMIPAVFMQIRELPVNPNGKVDRKRLPKPERHRPELGSDYVPPATKMEKMISRAWTEVLKLEKVGIYDRFFDLGGNSMKFIRVSERLHHYLGKDIPVVTMYQYPTIHSLARYLSGEVVIEAAPLLRHTPAETRQNHLDIAVIGLAGRFPGAKNIREFWENLEKGMESIVFFPDEELKEAGVPLQLLNNPNYVKARGFLEDILYFDAPFFNYTPREADLMDPQLRLFHECSWAALEDAGYNPETYAGRIGVYSGASPNVLWAAGTLNEARTPSEHYDAAVLNINSSFGTRISYLFGLRGPSFSIQTACSTSLVAVHLACQGLIDCECDIGLAGGISISNPMKSGYLYQEGMILSPDGHNRTFDAKAKGTVPGDGIGIVVLKRLKEAIADRDYIYAVVKSSAINNDGTRKVGYTAPSVEGQAEVIREALGLAKVKPESITYVETHGTGTTMGDPIEIRGLKLAFNTHKQQFCRIGSVKSNIGHLDLAAGIAGFIKTVLALNHRLIPPSLHFQSPNPEIDVENSPFVVNTQLTQWKTDGYPLRAGVSSFGIGGTNAHVVLEEWSDAHGAEPTEQGPRSQGRGGVSPPSPARNYQLILLSAKTQSALEKTTENFVNYVKENPEISLTDAAYTLQVGRKAFKYRRMLVCPRVEELQELSSSPVFVSTEDKRPVVFMFPGQGSQYVNMGLDIYRTEPIFHEEMDRCFEILKPMIGYDLKEILYPGISVSKVSKVSGVSVDSSDGSVPPPGTVDSPLERGTSDPGKGGGVSDINQTEITQPLIFSFEYALAKLLMHWGIRPDAMIGHSIGEYTAACLAGVFSLEDALTLVAARGQLMQPLPPGAMISVPLPEKEILPLLKDGLCLAAVNSPCNCVVSGPLEVVDTFAHRLKEMGHKSRPLHTSRAFHSAMMNPILEAFEDKVKQVPLNTPNIPYLSNVTGQWIAAETAVDPGYWPTHLRRTVRFFDGMTELLKKEGTAVLVEMGPGRVLSTLARQHPDKTSFQPTFNLVRHPKENIPDDGFLLTKIGNLWLQGTTIDWEAFYPGETTHRIPLPTYSFEKQPHQIQRESFLHPTAKTIPGVGAAGGPRLTKKTDIGEWFYTLSWKRVQLPRYKKDSIPSHTPWLVFMDNHGTSTRMAELLEKKNQELILVKPGANYQKENDRAFTLDPGQDEDYETLFRELASMKCLPQRILHLWGVSALSFPGPALEFKEVEHTLELGFYSLLNIARALGNLNIKDELHIDVVTSHMQEVTGEEQLSPAKATVLGPVKTISLEYPNIRCRSIDIVGDEAPVLAQLLAELSREVTAPWEVVALRRSHRWVQGIEPLHLEEPPKPIPRLRENGIYLVTGGLGGMGLVLAQHLAKTVNARLALIDFSDFPPPKQWDQWLNTHPENDKTSRKIRKIQELEKLGAKVLITKADAANREQMKRAMGKIEKAFGKVNGVIHTAGVPDGRLIPLRTREFTRRILAPKVKGTLVLDAFLQSHQPDFIVLCSSLNSLIGEIGQAGYIAANCFLDAFAATKSLSGSAFTVSINWDGWQEVGMAVGEPLHETFISRLNPNSHWVLGEHKVKGIPTLVGTAYLELVAAAFASHASDRDIEIRHLHYLSPLTAAEEDKEVHTLLEKEENQWQFSICTPLNLNDHRWQVHARGNIAAVETEASQIHNISNIRETCPQHIQVSHQPANPHDDPVDAQSQVVTVGPRWDNLKEVWLGENQGLARLELPAEFSMDTRFYKMHPALLDTATAFLIPHIYPKTSYLPFSFKRVRIKKPLPLKVFSYARLVEREAPQQQALELDITIMDETGTELIDIEGLTVLAVSKDKKENQPQGEVITLKPGKSTSNNGLKDGILPPEGVEVFNRVLCDNLPQVLVSTVDLPLRLEQERTRRVPGLIDTLQEEEAAEPTLPRPEVSTKYAPPGTEIQQTLAKIWQGFLGIQQIGIHDDLFELGADSLKALTVIARIHKELNTEVSITDMFTFPTIAQLAGYIESAKESLYSSIAPVEEKEYYPLSSAQKRLYYLQQMHKESVFYNLPMIFIVEGQLRKDRPEKAFQELIRQHESLRTSFQLVDEEPVQRIHDEVEFEIEYYLIHETHEKHEKFELTTENTEGTRVLAPLSIDPAARSSQLATSTIKNFFRPFDLSQAPLLRLEILQIDKEKYLWLFDIHHIVIDATGCAVLHKELERLYNNKELPAVKVRYKDFSQWQNHMLASGRIKTQQDYWLKVYPDGVPELKLPTDYPRPQVSTFEGDRHYFRLSETETSKFLDLGSSVGATLFIYVLAVLNVLLFKYTGQGDIVIGSSIAGRPHADIQDIVGMFVNMLAMRNFPGENMTYLELLKNVKTNSLKAFENQDLQFEMLVEQLNIKTGSSGNPLFNICLNVENYEHAALNIKGLTFTPYPYEPDTSKFDMLLWANPVEKEIHFMLEYSTELFKPSTAEEFSNHFIEIIRQVIENKDIRLKDIKISHKVLTPESEVPEIDFGF